MCYICTNIQTKITRNMENTKSLRRMVMEMNIGNVLHLSIDTYSASTIRHYASELGWAMGRKYSVARNRELREYQVLRIS